MVSECKTEKIKSQPGLLLILVSCVAHSADLVLELVRPPWGVCAPLIPENNALIPQIPERKFLSSLKVSFLCSQNPLN